MPETKSYIVPLSIPNTYRFERVLVDAESPEKAKAQVETFLKAIGDPTDLVIGTVLLAEDS